MSRVSIANDEHEGSTPLTRHDRLLFRFTPACLSIPGSSRLVLNGLNAAIRLQEVASQARQAKEFLKKQRPDLAIPEFRASSRLIPIMSMLAATSVCC
jgi:hypothetical protein